MLRIVTGIAVCIALALLAPGIILLDVAVSLRNLHIDIASRLHSLDG